jgi:hypothetical protein
MNESRSFQITSTTGTDALEEVTNKKEVIQLPKKELGEGEGQM